MAKRTPAPKLAKTHVLAIFNPWPLAITSGHQLKLSKFTPSFRGKTSLHQCTLNHGFRNGSYMKYIPFISLLFWSPPKIIPIQHSPPARKTRSQVRAQAVLTLTPRAPLDNTPEVPQLRGQLDRGPIMEGAEPFREEGRGPVRSNSFSGVVGQFPALSRTTLKGPVEDGEEEEENYDGTEGVPACKPLRYDQISKRFTRKTHHNSLKTSGSTINRYKI
ncbi:hypothetical protein O181_089662 [Austropuccinia psidii MF-1]|uniref:Uncharacterized protein n=1 Tax=Austropuccinia psidii MF-1 TaxID=1389203 RepID=A0A9Q3IU00_9BASI|nr:hypothetical protein [Austropuccinia psidii MF-1]